MRKQLEGRVSPARQAARVPHGCGPVRSREAWKSINTTCFGAAPAISPSVQPGSIMLEEPNGVVVGSPAPGPWRAAAFQSTIA